MDEAVLGWLGLVERLVAVGDHRAVLWLIGPESRAAENGLEAVCRRTGTELRRVADPGDREVLDGVGLVLLEGDPTYHSVSTLLAWISPGAGAERATGTGAEAAPPVILVPRVGWPYDRRDTYPDPAVIPPESVHPHRRGGLLPGRDEPVPGEGFGADVDHAILAHPFRNGRLTAVEDFVRTHDPRLRCQVLPGFHGLAVVAPPAAIDGSDALGRLFEAPGELLIEMGHLDRLEQARVLARIERSRPPAANPLPEPPTPGPASVPSAPERPTVAESRPGPDAGEAAARELGEARSRLAASSRLAARDAEVRRLSIALLDARGNVLDLLGSNRWRIGDRIGNLVLKARRRSKTETAADRLTELFDEVETWGLEANLRAASPHREPSAETKSAAEAAEVAEEPMAPVAASLFHRLAAGAEPAGAAGEGLRSALQRSDRTVAAVRRRCLDRRPLVSVVMPTRDRAHLIGQAVTSVLEQSYGEWELIVCEDGEATGTEAVLEAFGDSRIRYLSIPSSGGAAARNRALATARGRWIAYLDDDNLWHPAFLETMVGTLESRPAYFGAFCGYLDLEIEDGRSRLRAVGPGRFDYEAVTGANSIDLNTLVHCPSLHRLFGGFDEGLARHQDWDLALRYGFVTDLLPVDALLCLYRRNRQWGQITTSERGDRSWQRVRAAVERFYDEGGPSRSGAGDTRPVTLLFDGEDRGARADASALARGLSVRRATRLLPLAEAEDDGELARGGVVLAVRPPPAALERLRSMPPEGRSVLVVVRDLDDLVPRAPAEPATSSASEVIAVEALSPDALPAGWRWFPPVGEAVPAAERDGPVRIVGESGADEVESLERELEARGLEIARLGSGDREEEPLGNARALVVVSGPGCPPGVGAAARRAIVEALAAGVPVVTHPFDEIRTLADDDCVVLVGGGAGEVAEAVAATVGNDGLVARLAANGRRRWLRRYSPGAVANVVDLLAAGLAERKGEREAGDPDGST